MRAPSGNRGLALRWPLPVGALVAGCGLAVLVYQAGAVPVTSGHGGHLVLGPLAPLQGTSADAPQRSPLRPVDVTQRLFVAVELAPAAATSGLHASAGEARVVAMTQHALLLIDQGTPPPSSLTVVTDPPTSGTDAGTTVPVTTTDPGTTTTDSATTTTDPAVPTTDPATTTTDPATTTTDPAVPTTDPATTTTDPATTTTDPATTTTDPATITTDPATITTDPATATDATTAVIPDTGTDPAATSTP